MSRLAVGWGSLTPAELRVVALVMEGTSNTRIAQRLCLSRYTVESHLKHVFVKLSVDSRAALAAEAARRKVTEHTIPELRDVAARFIRDPVARNGSRLKQKEETVLSIDVLFARVDLYESEEAGDTHLAVYIHANGREIFRWNNNRAKVTAPNTYELGVAGPVISVDRRVLVEVFAWTDDDSDWPGPGQCKHDLGSSYVVLGPETVLGPFQIGPTRTGRGNDGYRVYGFTRQGTEDRDNQEESCPRPRGL